MLFQIKKYKPSFLDLLGLLLLAIYTLLFWQSLSKFWFSPEWVTDDALQQIFPFHEVKIPGLFKDDIVTESMLGYLPPLHYWLCYCLTYLSGDPIMMSHWAMFIQLSITVVFIFLAVKNVAGTFPASIAAIWFLHSRHLVQRLTGGLPRGWLAPFMAMYLFLILQGCHRSILILIFFACGFNPLAAFLTILTYGATLVWRLILPESRAQTVKPFVMFLIACPFYFAITHFSISRSDNIGRMYTYQEMLQMPELSKDDGRFKLVPLPSAEGELKLYGAQSFVTEFYPGIKFFQHNAHYIIVSIFLLLLLISAIRRKLFIPIELLIFLFCTLLAYFMARLFAFQLYIPGRYLRLPIGIFLVSAFSAGVWNAFRFDAKSPGSTNTFTAELKNNWPALCAMSLLALMIYAGSGTGLLRQANFNYKKGVFGQSFEWLSNNTPLDSVIAGQPNFMDSVPLFAKRRVYVSNEVAHPFYNNYYALIKKRLDISLRAHYAKSLKEMLAVIGDEKIDYFVFDRNRFYISQLKKASYFAPFNVLVKDLTSGDPSKYAYRELPEALDKEKYPFFVFKDKYAVVIDVQKLREYSR